MQNERVRRPSTSSSSAAAVPAWPPPSRRARPGARWCCWRRTRSSAARPPGRSGSITSTGTPHQLRAGVQDRPQDHFDDMPLFAGDLAGRDNDELRRILCEEVPDAFRWLLSLGVRFFGPMPEPPHRQPRMHNVLPNSLSYIYHLERHARRIGVEIVADTRVTELVTEDGAVVGAAVRRWPPVPRPPRRGARHGRLHQRPGAQGALHGAAAGEGRRRQHHRDRRWPEARAAAGRAHRQRRSGAGPRDPLHPARAHDAGSPAAALAGAGAHHGVGHGARAASVAAAVHHELSDHCAGAFAQAVRGGRHSRQPGRPALLRRAGRARSGAAGSAREDRLHSRRRHGSRTSSPPGRTSSRPRPGWPMPTCPTTGATGRTSIPRPRPLRSWHDKLGMDPHALHETIALSNAAASLQGAEAQRSAAARPAVHRARSGALRLRAQRRRPGGGSRASRARSRRIGPFPASTRPAPPARAACC